jgi:hypothetical protein
MGMSEFDTKLISLLMKAIRSPEKWDRVLKHILATTDAQAAIITLRDRVTCQIVNDVSLEEKYHSPLIQGFEYDAVAYYLTELRTIDPWADAQRTHHPHHPTLMSGICPIASVTETRFFDWLARIGMRDTVVFEFKRSPGFWSACKLLLEGKDPAAAARLMDYANTHFQHISDAWTASQDLIRCQQSGQAALEQLGKLQIPACVAGTSGEVMRTNAAFESLFENDAVRLSGPFRRLSLANNSHWIDDTMGFDKCVAYHGYVDEPAEVAVEPFEPDPLYRDKREQLWLLTFGFSAAARKQDQLITFDRQKLSDQEDAFFVELTGGAEVIEAGENIGVARTRSFELWAAIREKLNIKSIHQIRP